MVNKKTKLRKFPRPTKGFTRDVKGALKIGKKILGRRPLKSNTKKKLKGGIK